MAGVEPRDLRPGLHAQGVKALLVKREGLVQQGLAVADEFGRLVGLGKRQLVVNELGGTAHQVEGAVRVGLGKGVPLLGKAPAKVRELPGRCRVLRVYGTNKAQRKALVVLASGVMCHGVSSQAPMVPDMSELNLTYTHPCTARSSRLAKILERGVFLRNRLGPAAASPDCYAYG